MTAAPRIERLRGSAILDRLEDLARLRIAVFRDYPYLYDGGMAYERRYMQTYAASPHAVLVAAFDGDAVVGASTAVPLSAGPGECIEPFRQHGYDIGSIFYFGESVLLRPYRGLGVGVRFFAEREAAARAHGGIVMAAFCGVDRAEDHTLRPKDYVPLDAFWTKRGYTRHPELTAKFHWQDIGDQADTYKTLTFWLKKL